MNKTVLTVQGTHCNACKMLLEEVIGELPGVSSVNVDFKTGKTEIEHQTALDKNELKKSIEDLGDYKAQL